LILMSRSGICWSPMVILEEERCDLHTNT
jgi:hypothetical protein